MASRKISNNVIGILNAITFLLSVPILGVGIWLGVRGGGTECERLFLSAIITLGVFLVVVSIAGTVGACCGVNWLLLFYLVAMFVLIVVLSCFTVFAFVVTNKGPRAETVYVSAIGQYKEYRLGDYSPWLQKRVQSSKNWNKIKSCLQDTMACKSLQDKKPSQPQFVLYGAGLTPIQSGCCKPPNSCGYTYVRDTWWTNTTAINSTNPDCKTWSNWPKDLCYDCQSCKAGVVATIKRDWERGAIINNVFLAFIVIFYAVGCCAFRNNIRDNANNHGGWKKGAGPRYIHP